MPLYMDHHHKVDGLTAEAVAGAHQRDLELQGKHGANYVKYWFNEGTGAVFCLVEAPTKEAAAAVHREAHGLVADDITEVQEGGSTVLLLAAGQKLYSGLPPTGYRILKYERSKSRSQGDPSREVSQRPAIESPS